MSEWKGVAVYIEQYEGDVEPVSWELLGKGRELADKSGQELLAIVLGSGIKELGKQCRQMGADKVVLCDHPLLNDYRWETYSKVMYDVIKTYMPSSLIIGATHNGRDMAGRIAVRAHTGLTADVVALDMEEDGLLLGSVPGFGGSILAVIRCEEGRPQIATVRPGIFTAPVPKAHKGKIINHKVELSEADVQTIIIKKERKEYKDISKTDRLVAAGRGIGGELDTVKKIAELLKAEIGLTRPLCDIGMLPRDHQIGSTGVSVKPKFSLVLGASGAAHFVSGIKESDVIYAVNIDPEATIFEHADYGVVADLSEFLPALLKSIRAKIMEVRK